VSGNRLSRDLRSKSKGRDPSWRAPSTIPRRQGRASTLSLDAIAGDVVSDSGVLAVHRSRRLVCKKQQLLVHHPRDEGQDAGPFHKSPRLPADPQWASSIAPKNLADDTAARLCRQGKLHVSFAVLIFWAYADRIHKFTPNPWRTSSPLCAGLGFRYTPGLRRSAVLSLHLWQIAACAGTRARSEDVGWLC